MIKSDKLQEWLLGLPQTDCELSPLQILSRQQLAVSGLPSRKTESWRLDHLNRLEKFISLPISNHKATEIKSTEEFLPKPEKGSFRIILGSNEDFNETISFPKGIKKLSYQEISEKLGGEINSSKDASNWIRGFNKATVSNLLGLSIEGKIIPPIELIITSEMNTLNTSRVIIFIEEKTTLDLLQVIIGNTNCAINHLLELKLEAHAKINQGLLALGKSNTANIQTAINVEQKPKSDYSLTSLHQGWFYSRFEPQIVQTDGYATTTLKGLQVTNKKDQGSTHSFVKFNGPHGRLDQLQKAVATESSHAIFNGAIQVPKVAQKTEASQLSRNLLLSKSARIDTKPELEIVADDVRCTHGATVSQLQEEEFFYLKSRGIDNNNANSLLLKGYYDEIVSKLPLNANRWDFLNKIIECAQE